MKGGVVLKTRSYFHNVFTSDLGSHRFGNSVDWDSSWDSELMPPKTAPSVCLIRRGWLLKWEKRNKVQCISHERGSFVCLVHLGTNYWFNMLKRCDCVSVINLFKKAVYRQKLFLSMLQCCTKLTHVMSRKVLSLTKLKGMNRTPSAII